MATNLEKLLKGYSSRTKNYLRPCRAHVFNLAVLHSWKDDVKHIEGLEAISQRPFGEILHRLRKLIIVVNHYKNLCDKLEMTNKNIILEDVWTMWSSTYDMIKAAWEKKRSVQDNGERPSKHK